MLETVRHAFKAARNAADHMTPHMTLTLAAKLGSLAVHVEEALSPQGHPFDVQACRGITTDPEVVAFLAELRELALLPERR